MLTKRNMWTAQKEILLAQLRLALRNANTDKIVIASSLRFDDGERDLVDETVRELQSGLSDYAAEEGQTPAHPAIEVVYAENILQNSRAIKTMGETGAVVYWEKLEKTKREDARAEARMCRDLGIRCLGSVLFSGDKAK